MAGNTDRRAILVVVGVAVSAVGAGLLSVFLDAGTSLALLATLFVWTGAGLSMVVDGLQRRVAVGVVSSGALLVGAVPTVAVGLGAVGASLADPSATFATLALLFGVGSLVAALAMVAVAVVLLPDVLAAPAE